MFRGSTSDSDSVRAGGIDKLIEDLNRTRGRGHWRAESSRPSAASLLVLAQIGSESPEVVAFFTEKLSDPDRVIRLAAAEGLGRMGRIAQPAVRALEKSLGDESVAVRVTAAMALWQVNESTEGLDVMIDALENRRWWERRYAVVGQSGDQFAMMRRTTSIPTWWPPLAAECVSVIGEMGPRAQKAAPTLGLVVRFWSGPAQERAIGALARMGGAAIEAVPRLEEVIARTSDQVLREKAASEIQRIKSDQVASGSRSPQIPASSSETP